MNPRVLAQLYTAVAFTASVISIKVVSIYVRLDVPSCFLPADFKIKTFSVLSLIPLPEPRIWAPFYLDTVHFHDSK
jgi:hypothetical protein